MVNGILFSAVSLFTSLCVEWVKAFDIKGAWIQILKACYHCLKKQMGSGISCHASHHVIGMCYIRGESEGPAMPSTK